MSDIIYVLVSGPKSPVCSFLASAVSYSSWHCQHPVTCLAKSRSIKFAASGASSHLFMEKAELTDRETEAKDN